MIRRQGRTARAVVAALVALVLVGAAGCAPSADLLYDATCAGTLVGTTPGTVTAPALREVSGIATSTDQPDVLWVHNDSGDSARVFAIETTGALLGTFTLSGAGCGRLGGPGHGSGPDGGAVVPLRRRHR